MHDQRDTPMALQQSRYTPGHYMHVVPITGQVRARTLWGEEDSTSFCKSSEELPLHVPSYWVSLTSSLLAFTLLREVLADISVCAIISDMHGRQLVVRFM